MTLGIQAGQSRTTVDPDIEKMSRDSDTKVLLQKIFNIPLAAQILEDMRHVTAGGASAPFKVVPLNREECKLKNIEISSVRHVLGKSGQVCRSIIYYDKTLDERLKLVYLTIEILNAYFADKYALIAKNYEQYNAQDYAVEVEKIEWMSTLFSRDIIATLYPDLKNTPPFFDDFDRYLDWQSVAGHTQRYVDQHKELDKQKYPHLYRGRKCPDGSPVPDWMS